MTDQASPKPNDGVSNDEYVVVARRYRPQTFGELIGQDHATRALRNAIETNRVGHAYLFTGARGVGKTSAARIFSKALNCESGPTPTPCGTCDACEGIAAGNDVDVLEIDGASNRGIDEIRQLRSNVNVRPSRARTKIYIIDEVHMLTKEAFNALLKTLEEPPEHVKFIFCTTDPEKIPITVLSRCQRFDFSPVAQSAIVDRLAEIVAAEGGTAETEALDLLARRAAGSMRDSQSLLEQLLSFGGSDITVDGVHSLLGTADNRTVADIAMALRERDAAAALVQLDVAVGRGVDVGQLAEQLMGYLRDVMAAVVGAPAELFRCASPAELDQLKELGDTWGVETLLAAIQILDQALVRMRQSVDRRIVVETALMRISHLESLQSIPDLLAALQTGVPLAAPPRANPGKAPRSAAPSAAPPATSKTTSAPPPPNPGGGKKKDVSETVAGESVSQPVANDPPANDDNSGTATAVAVGTTAAIATAATVAKAANADATPQATTPEPEATTTQAAATTQSDPAPATQADPAPADHATPEPEATTNQAAAAPQPTPPIPAPQTTAVPQMHLDSRSALKVWNVVADHLDGMDGPTARSCTKVSLETDDLLVIEFDKAFSAARIRQTERRTRCESILHQIAGRRVRIDVRSTETKSAKPVQRASQAELIRDAMRHPLVQRAQKMFDADINRVLPPDPPKE